VGTFSPVGKICGVSARATESQLVLRVRCVAHALGGGDRDAETSRQAYLAGVWDASRCIAPETGHNTPSPFPAGYELLARIAIRPTHSVTLRVKRDARQEDKVKGCGARVHRYRQRRQKHTHHSPSFRQDCRTALYPGRGYPIYPSDTLPSRAAYTAGASPSTGSRTPAPRRN